MPSIILLTKVTRQNGVHLSGPIPCDLHLVTSSHARWQCSGLTLPLTGKS